MNYKSNCSLEAPVLKQRLTCFGHILRSKEMNIMLGKVQGKGRRERQKTWWIEGVTKETNKSPRELCEVTRDRKGWRNHVRGITMSRRQLDGTWKQMSMALGEGVCGASSYSLGVLCYLAVMMRSCEDVYPCCIWSIVCLSLTVAILYPMVRPSLEQVITGYL